MEEKLYRLRFYEEDGMWFWVVEEGGGDFWIKARAGRPTSGREKTFDKAIINGRWVLSQLER